METPLTIKFRWTADELVQAQRLHLRQSYRWLFRLARQFGFALVLAGGLFMLWRPGSQELAPLPLALSLSAISIFWWAVMVLFIQPWFARRRFARRPDCNRDIEWQVSDDKICTRSALAQSELSWAAFTKFVATPAGVLIYPNDQMFHWLPRHGFANEADFRSFIGLAKSKIPQHTDAT